MEESSPMDMTIRGQFQAYVGYYINGNKGALQCICWLLLDRMEILSHMRGDFEQRLRELGSTGHELLYGSEDFGEDWEDLLLG